MSDEKELNMQEVKQEDGRVRSGQARMKRMTAEERSELARLAAKTRWENQSESNIHVTMHGGSLRLGATAISCAVLVSPDLGREVRVLSERELARAFGAKRGGSHWRRRAAGAPGSDMPLILSAGNLQPFIDDELREALGRRYTYKVKGGGNSVAYGMEAELLPQICEVLLRARDAGKLIGGQAEIALAADILIRSLAKVGIVALVDEATGFQRTRDREALQEFLSQLIGHELAKWEKRFPDEFYRQIFRLKGWTYDSRSSRRPMQMAQITADIVFQRLGPSVLDELRERMPQTSTGKKKGKLHQLLTLDVGAPALSKHLEKVIILATATDDYNTFYEMLGRVAPNPDKTPSLF